MKNQQKLIFFFLCVIIPLAKIQVFVSSFVCPSEFEYLKIDSNYMPKKIKYQNVNSRNT